MGKNVFKYLSILSVSLPSISKYGKADGLGIFSIYPSSFTCLPSNFPASNLKYICVPLKAMPVTAQEPINKLFKVCWGLSCTLSGETVPLKTNPPHHIVKLCDRVQQAVMSTLWYKNFYQ
jgi:hypothetical protein